MAGSLLTLAVFVVYQRARTRRSGSPLVELGLFRHKSFTGGLLVNLLFSGAITGFLLVFVLYLQIGLSFSVLRSGFTIIPWGPLVPVFAGLGTAVLAPKFGRAVLQIGIVLDIAAMAGIWLTVHYGHLTAVSFVPALAVGGIGMGLVVAPLLDFTLADVPVADAGSASGLYNTIQQLGGAIGIGGIGTPSQSSTVDIEDLVRKRAELIAEFRALPRPAPQYPTPARATHPRHTLSDLAKAGALTIHQQPLTKIDLTETGAGQMVLTGRDVIAGSAPTLRLPEPTDGLIILRRGDMVIAQLAAASCPIPHVLTEQPANDLVLGPNLQLIRVNEARVDVHYLAGLLATTEPTSVTTSDVHRLDLRCVTIPVPDLETQRRQGAQFRHLTEFRTRLGAV